MLENKNKVIPVWCPLTVQQLKLVEKLSLAGNSADKIANALKVDMRLFMHDYKTIGTPIFDAYQRGVVLNQSIVHEATLKKAKRGNMTAIQQMNKIWEAQNLENLKNEIFNTE
ncbi:Uncharacterised protein [Chryseobacterium nakagawai]|uniref:Uncharacterized protein n=1 Tax=Chryseobacterium nakagawai TaxID=1241982 RepID=A0AAD1DSQ0_CHRNA|nr:hypothetical protein [Chryseobacterium nakagawai]AZA93051.1 hypothetical protein EG343_21825 [Chryseobacterium nakagawai]VEH19684.1 Uncharacterised protein [Chryseobacterium nakagawai]